MSFENDYKSFLKSIILNDFLKAESIIAQSDNKSTFIIRAMDDLDLNRVKNITDNFRSVGLKRGLESTFNEYKKQNNSENIVKKSNKIILVHKKNKIKNEIYHLSGSSFENKNYSKEELLSKVNESKNIKLGSLG